MKCQIHNKMKYQKYKSDYCITNSKRFFQKKYNPKGKSVCTILSSSFCSSFNTCPYHQGFCFHLKNKGKNRPREQRFKIRIQYYEKLLFEAILITFPTCFLV